MIWFACKKCNKKHGRADNLAGTMVFCDQCGQGNTVPWQSTTSAPETPPEPPPRPLPPAPPPTPRRPPDDRDRGRDWDRRAVAPAAGRPRLGPAAAATQPLRRRRVGQPPPVPPPEPMPPGDASAGDLLRRRRAQVFRRHRPGFCFNHDDVATDKTCTECKGYFCPNCIVELQGKTMCGPCKNFRIRGLHRPGKVPPMAIVAVIVGLLSGPVTFCLTWMGSGQQLGGVGTLVLSIIGLVLPLGGLAASGVALRQIESRPNMGGRGLAMTGATSSLVGALWCATVTFLVIMHMAQG